MIPGDLGAELACALRDAVAAGELPARAASLTADGTWRKPPPGATNPGPGTYATSLPLALARIAGRPAATVAALLARPLRGVPWISAARVTGAGYLTITVTTGCLAALAARAVAAGPAAARSGALAGSELTAPPLPDLSAAPSWPVAWRGQRDALAGRLAQAAGATVMFAEGERNRAPASPARPDSGPVRAAVAYRGLDAVRYALARTARPAPRAIERQLGARLDLQNAFVMVTYAHADAASVGRWAADLGMASARAEVLPAATAAPGVTVPSGRSGRSGPEAVLLRSPELALLDAISWLPERTAAAARQRRPAVLTAHLEELAGAWLDCRESCPALPFGGAGAPRDPTGALASGRLTLAAAARAALDSGLRLLGVTAPDRM